MNDLRDALRALRATPLVSSIAVLSLALGIGANTAMFSIIDSLVLRTLPVPPAERLVMIGDTPKQTSWTNPIWEQIRDRPALFDGALAWSGARFNLARAGETDLIDGIWASGGFFDVLEVRPVLGRTFHPEDDRRGVGTGGPVAVISYGYWQRRYGGATTVIGSPITLNNTLFTIVGVTPPEFFGPEVGRTFDVVVPLAAEPIVRGKESWLDRRSTWWLSVMARLKPGQSIEAATAALRTAQPQIREATLPADFRPQDLKEYFTETLSLYPSAAGSSSLRTRYQRPLITIMIVVGLVLLIACGNIANLLLARATARRHELSVRQALGASRFRLVRQLLAESILLSGAGAVLGLLIAQWASRLLVNQLSSQGNRVFLDLAIDWRMLGFTATVAIGTALLFGTVPALLASRVQPIDALKEHGRGTSSERRVGLGGGLVIAQVALSLVLVIAAGLFVRTFASLSELRLGFDRERLLVTTVGAQSTGVDTAGRPALYEQMRQAVLAVPGVSNAATSVIVPVGGGGWNTRVDVPGGPTYTDRQRLTYMNLVSPGWFGTLGTPILAGRDLMLADGAGTPHVGLVNQAFVRHFMPGANPLGRTILREGQAGKPRIEIQVVGLVADAVYRSLRDSVPPTMYLMLAQETINVPSSISLTVRAQGGSPASLSRAVGAAITRVNPNVTLTFRTMAEQIEASLTQERIVAMLSAFFGGLALLLAALGLYGITSYSVNRRGTELGIRMALGTPPAGVMRLVLRRVAIQVGAGIVIGALASWWAGRFVAALLYGLAPRDPVTIAMAVVVLGTIGAVAGWLPARRAARIDPAIVLRGG